MPTIADASPLIFYARIARLSVLQQIFSEILVPPAVWDEIMADQANRPGASEIASAHWIQQRALVQPMSSLDVPYQIDAGEAEAIELALEFGRGTTFISDDSRARSLATVRGLTVIGSAGVTLVAKRRGIFERATPVLEELRGAGLYLSDEVFQEIVVSAEE